MNLIESSSAQFEPYKIQLLAQCKTLSPLYQPVIVRYLQCYYQDHSADCSFIIELGKKPLLLVLLSAAPGQPLSFYQLPVKFVWLQDIDNKARQGANKVALKHLSKLMSGVKVHYCETANNALSEFALLLLKQGYQVMPKLNQIVDLEQTEAVLFSDIRKIFRANIRWGQAQLQLKLLNADNIVDGDIEAFRQLHIKVVGSESRSQQTWQLQQQMIMAGEAFAFYGYLGGELVSCGLFIYNSLECYYSVGAYDRNLFDKPISHAMVWQAMLEAKKLGCKKFDFGDTYFPAQQNTQGSEPSEKELAISHFKQGFGGSINTELVFVKS